MLCKHKFTAISLLLSIATATLASNNALQVTMLAMHLADASIVYPKYIGIKIHQYFASTFINTFNDRTYAVGYIHSLYNKEHPNKLKSNAGLYYGLMHGYDARFHKIAGHTPVVPIVGAFYDYGSDRFGLQFSYVGVVVSAGLYLSY